MTWASSDGKFPNNHIHKSRERPVRDILMLYFLQWGPVATAESMEAQLRCLASVRAQTLKSISSLSASQIPPNTMPLSAQQPREPGGHHQGWLRPAE